MVPGYTDISHFRAPYKNSYLYTGVGADAPTPDEINAANPTTTDAQNRKIYKPEVQSVIMESLKGHAAIWLSDRAVALEPIDPAQPLAPGQVRASDWVEQKLGEGNVVFATLGVVFPQANLTRQLAAVPEKDKSTVVMTSHIAPILAEPSFLAKFGTPLAVGAAVLVGGVVVYAVYAGMKKKKGGGSSYASA
jgi:hypothetical protein